MPSAGRTAGVIDFASAQPLILRVTERDRRLLSGVRELSASARMLRAQSARSSVVKLVGEGGKGCGAAGVPEQDTLVFAEGAAADQVEKSAKRAAGIDGIE